MDKQKIIWGLVRIALGWILFWACIDKVFGLKFATPVGKAVINGYSPTVGFLKNGTYGPFAHMFQSMTGNPVVDWLFMLGLFGVGLALILGIGMRIAVASGVLMMLFIYMSMLPPKQNPIVDEHIIYILVLIGLGVSNAGDTLGFGRWWKQTWWVKKYPVLQ